MKHSRIIADTAAMMAQLCESMLGFVESSTSAAQNDLDQLSERCMNLLINKLANSQRLMLSLTKLIVEADTERKSYVNRDPDEKTIDICAQVCTIKSREKAEDGGQGSGNRNHAGVPGKVGGSLPATTAEVINEAIKSGKISTKLSISKQRKHRKGSDKYLKAVAAGNHVSYLNIDDDEIQKIVDSKAGTGKPYCDGSQFKETIDAGKTVGVFLSKTGEASETTRLTIHYGAKGCHVVPARPRKG